jgi:hypothetical protein
VVLAEVPVLEAAVLAEAVLAEVILEKPGVPVRKRAPPITAHKDNPMNAWLPAPVHTLLPLPLNFSLAVARTETSLFAFTPF